MTRQFFHDQMKLIIENFGPDEYKPGRVQIIWEACQDLPDKTFAWIVKHFLRSKSVKYPPLPDHFIEEAINQRKVLNDGHNYTRESYEVPMPAGDALNDVLKALGASSAFEAAQKAKLKIIKPEEGA